VTSKTFRERDLSEGDIISRDFRTIFGAAAAIVLAGCGAPSGVAAPVATVTVSADVPPAATVTVVSSSPVTQTVTAKVTERRTAVAETVVVTEVGTVTEKVTAIPKTIVRTTYVPATAESSATAQPDVPTVDQPSSTTAERSGPTPKKQQYSGTGDDVVEVTLGNDPRVLTFVCTSCGSNTVLQGDGQDTLLVNAIGSYSGRHFVNLASDLTRLQISADSSWTITLEPVSVLARDKNRTQGHGDDVVYFDKGSKAAITHTGEANFVVQETSDSAGKDLLVNEIGKYRGTVPLNTPSVLEITADGDWTIAPS